LASALSTRPAVVHHGRQTCLDHRRIAVDWRVLTGTSLLSILTGIVLRAVSIASNPVGQRQDALNKAKIRVSTSPECGVRVLAGKSLWPVLRTGAGLMTQKSWKLTQCFSGSNHAHSHRSPILPPRYSKLVHVRDWAASGDHRRPRNAARPAYASSGGQSAACTSNLPLSGVDMRVRR